LIRLGTNCGNIFCGKILVPVNDRVSNWFVGDLQICCHFQHKTARPTSKQMVKTNTFPICFPKMFQQLVPSLNGLKT